MGIANIEKRLRDSFDILGEILRRQPMPSEDDILREMERRTLIGFPVALKVHGRRKIYVFHMGKGAYARDLTDDEKTQFL